MYIDQLNEGYMLLAPLNPTTEITLLTVHHPLCEEVCAPSDPTRPLHCAFQGLTNSKKDKGIITYIAFQKYSDR